MTAQIYNIAATTVNTILMNPFTLIVLMVVALAIVSGPAGRVASCWRISTTTEYAVGPHSHPRPPRVD